MYKHNYTISECSEASRKNILLLAEARKQKIFNTVNRHGIDIQGGKSSNIFPKPYEKKIFPLMNCFTQEVISTFNLNSMSLIQTNGL